MIDQPVKHYSKERGIVDLMLSRALRRHRADELDHLVVELKAPKVVIGKDEINQIEEYAFAVTSDERFNRTNVQWTFWVLSDQIDAFAENRVLEGEAAKGTIYKKGNVTIAIKTWAELIEDNKARLQYFQDKLQHTVDDETSLKFLQERYQQFLEGVVAEPEAAVPQKGQPSKKLAEADS